MDPESPPPPSRLGLPPPVHLLTLALPRLLQELPVHYPGLLSTISSPATAHASAKAALQFVVTLTTKFPVTNVEFCKRGFGPAVLEVLPQHPTLGCALLANFAFVDLNVEPLLSQKICPAIMAQLAAQPDPNTCVNAARALRNLSATTHEAEVFMSGCLDPVLALVPGLLDNEDYCVEVLGLIANLAQDEANQTAMFALSYPAVSAICKAYTPDHVSIAHQACRALANLSEDSYNQPSMQKSIAPVVALVLANKQDFHVVFEGLQFLANMAESGPTHKALFESFAQPLLGLVSAHMTSADVAEEAMALYANIAREPGVYRVPLVNMGVGTLVLDVIRAHVGDVDVLDEACACLLELCLDPANLPMLKLKGAAEAVQHIKDLVPDVCAQLLELLGAAT